MTIIDDDEPGYAALDDKVEVSETTQEIHVTVYRQGLTLVHFSAQRKCFLWDRGCIYGFFRGC